MTMASRADWLRLSLTPGLGPVGVRTLLNTIGPPAAILDADPAVLARVVGSETAAALLARDSAREQVIAQSLGWAQTPGQRLICLTDAEYPAALSQIHDPPPVLYLRGRADALAGPALAIVGSRNASADGLENARAFALTLGRSGLCIVSGLALGIDAAAHRGALAAAAPTVGVLGTGVDAPYPRANAALAEAIVDAGGALISEFPLGTGPRREHFPRRNRLIAGLSQGVLVVEAALRSGSLITARLAADCGRDVFAIPGSIHAPLSRGCHQLIRTGAKLVETAADIVEEFPLLALRLAGAGVAGSRTGAPAASATAGRLFEIIGWDPVSAEHLAFRADAALDAGRMAAALLELELAGAIERLADGRYRRRSAHV